MGSQLARLTEKYGLKHNVLKGSPKFPTEIIEWKMCAMCVQEESAQLYLNCN